jgi:hypothetical protein
MKGIYHLMFVLLPVSNATPIKQPCKASNTAHCQISHHLCSRNILSWNRSVIIQNMSISVSNLSSHSYFQKLGKEEQFGNEISIIPFFEQT